MDTADPTIAGSIKAMLATLGQELKDTCDNV